MSHMVSYQQAYLTYTPEKIRETYYALNFVQVQGIGGYTPTDKVVSFIELSRMLDIESDEVYQIMRSYKTLDQAKEALKELVVKRWMEMRTEIPRLPCSLGVSPILWTLQRIGRELS